MANEATMANEDRTSLLQAVAGMTKRNHGHPDVARAVNVLAEEEFGITTVDYLRGVNKTARIYDGCSFAFTQSAEYMPFSVNTLAQIGIAPLVGAYAKEHGKFSAGTIILGLLASNAIPSLGATVMGRAMERVGPKYNLPRTPEYQGPGLKKNIDFRPIVSSPLSSFIVSDAVTKAVTALIKDPQWAAYAGVGTGWMAAFKQIWESGKILYGKREKITTDYGVEIHQPWLEGTDEEIRECLRSLLHLHVAVESYAKDVFTGTVVNFPGNMAAAVVSPKTYSTFIALAPSATTTMMGVNTEDPTEQLAWGILAAITAIGLPGTTIGMTNQPFWQWILEKGTLDYWSAENADKFGDLVQDLVEKLIAAIANKLIEILGAAYNFVVPQLQAIAG